MQPPIVIGFTIKSILPFFPDIVRSESNPCSGTNWCMRADVDGWLTHAEAWFEEVNRFANPRRQPLIASWRNFIDTFVPGFIRVGQVLALVGVIKQMAKSARRWGSQVTDVKTVVAAGKVGLPTTGSKTELDMLGSRIANFAALALLVYIIYKVEKRNG